MPSRRVISATATAIGLAAATLATTMPLNAATATAPQARAGADAKLELWANAKATAYSEGRWVFPDLGLHVLAPTTNVEVWSTRASYDDPIVSEVRTPAGVTALPAGSMTDFSGIDDFFVIKARRAGTSKVIARRRINACLSGLSERVDPTSAPTSPYPQWCSVNPYTLGSVMGIQKGYAVSPFTFTGPPRLALEPGRYDVETSISRKFWSVFGLTDQTGIQSTRLTVVEGCQDEQCARDQQGPVTTVVGGRSEAPGPRPTQRSSGRVAGPVPDLRALPAFGVALNAKRTTLRFAATTWNAGPSPLVIDGFRRRNDEVMDAYQYFFDAAGNQTGYQQVGTLEFHHANHQHWHFEDFSRYDLLDADKNHVARSRKQSWCLANTDAVDYTVPGADWRPESTDLSTACGDQSAISIREVLSTGSGDTYYQSRAGQAFKIGDLPNGVYYIRVEANPDRNLVEGDVTNNVADRRIRIGGSGANRWVKTYQVGNIVEPDWFAMRPSLRAAM